MALIDRLACLHVINPRIHGINRLIHSINQLFHSIIQLINGITRLIDGWGACRGPEAAAGAAAPPRTLNLPSTDMK